MSCSSRSLGPVAALLLGAWSGGGCAPELPEAAVQRQKDRALYAEVMASLGPKAGENLPKCEQISDRDLAGDCALHAVRNEARDNVETASVWCPKVPTGAWRDECYFMAADTAGGRGDLTGARALCHRAGAFRESCYRHQLQTELGQLVEHHHGLSLDQLERRVASARSRWSVHQNQAGEGRAWTHFFSEVFEARREAVAEQCGVVSEQRRGWCRVGAREARIRPG